MYVMYVYLLAYNKRRGGSTLRPGGGHRPPKCWPGPPKYFGFNQGRFYVGAGGAQASPQMLARPPKYFSFQQQKYVFLKFRLFLYSGKINTRISYCISNDEIADQILALSKSCYSLIRNSLAHTVFNTPKTCHITLLLASLHWLKIKERIEYKLLSLT